eukprot:CAMPEP_0201569618 /NCGR_PEP_ID=MMETSP0190_2-20130828/11406_1 /ASSEMBLY_ACC=CAM_ASM_000263 /TAXON_ID=37353 /ORGANISM="Rosalina sp." /LENGTH=295 /DNA_ID=CAMNT_0047992147 /DNA_START=40 /DNA_END=927 /DNA_ORIENTATION=-
MSLQAAITMLNEIIDVFTLPMVSQIAQTEVIQDTHSLLLADGDETKEEHTDYNDLFLQRQKLADKGFCKWVSDDAYKKLVLNLAGGYIRHNYQPQHDPFPNDVFGEIAKFYGITLGASKCVKLQSGQEKYLTTITNISLSTKLISGLEESDTNIIIVEEKQVPTMTLEQILTYLGHHNGVEPDPIPCPVRSIHMDQIASKWDAAWMDGFDKKTIFHIIQAANYLDIKCLVHLGCAKIATLIKQMDQKEINRIIEEEETYRRAHAGGNTDASTANNADNDDGGNENNGKSEEVFMK